MRVVQSKRTIMIGYLVERKLGRKPPRNGTRSIRPALHLLPMRVYKVSKKMHNRSNHDVQTVEDGAQSWNRGLDLEQKALGHILSAAFTTVTTIVCTFYSLSFSRFNCVI